MVCFPMLEKDDGERESVLQWHVRFVNGCYPGPMQCSLMLVFTKSARTNS